MDDNKNIYCIYNQIGKCFICRYLEIENDRSISKNNIKLDYYSVLYPKGTVNLIFVCKYNFN